jgi:hypothetical protein
MTRPTGSTKLRQLRRELLEAFPETSRLWIWRSKSWPSDLYTLYQELEQLLEAPLSNSESVLVKNAIVVLARLDRTERVTKALLKLATLGLTSRVSGERSHQENKAARHRRAHTLLERANEKLKRNPHQSLSQLAKSLSAKSIRDEFNAEGLLTPGSARSVRRTLAEFRRLGLL